METQEKISNKLREIDQSGMPIWEQIGAAANATLEYYTGSIVEIGMGSGYSTRPLLRTAAKYKTKVIGIDPFEKGIGAVPDPLNITMKKYLEIMSDCNLNDLIIYNEFSEAESLKTDLKKHLPIAFAYVDGCHLKTHALRDMIFMESLNVNVMACDDMQRVIPGRSEVPEAMSEFLLRNSYSILYSSGDKKTMYLIRNGIHD